MNPSSKELKGPGISTELFGGVLTYDGHGFYPGLELLNLVFGTDNQMLPGKEVEKVKVAHSSHDFARRLVWDKNFGLHPKRNDVFVDDGEAEDVLRHLLECLQLDIPSSTAKPKWTRAHFFPYTKSLIHWDARSRDKRTPNKINIERQYLRGGGALAFKILRLDANIDRLNEIREGFKELFGAEQTSLDRLASVLENHGMKESFDDASNDVIESKSKVFQDRFEETFREGIHNILRHTSLPSVSRIRAVINWTGYWLSMAELKRALIKTERAPIHFLCDCCGMHPQLRRSSQRCLKEVLSEIEFSVRSYVEEKGSVPKKADINKIRGFFWATTAAVSFLNAWRGRRHFTLGLDILETLVLAGCDHQVEVPFDHFLTEWLFKKCNIVVGREAAESGGYLSSLDSSVFEDNENQLAYQMSAAGLLAQYSDATRMVSADRLK